MNNNQIFEELNTIYKALMENNTDNDGQGDNKNEIETCTRFFSAHQNSFNRLENSGPSIKLSYFKSFEHNLVTLNGNIVDIFEPEITDVVNIVDGSAHYALYGQIASQSHYEFLANCNGIEHTDYRDITTLLLFLDLPVDNDTNSVVESETLKLVGNDHLKHKLPVVVYSFEERESFKIGQKLQISGYLTIDHAEEPSSTNIKHEDDEMNKNFRDQYQPDKVHTLFAFNLVKEPINEYLTGTAFIDAVNVLKTCLLNILKDKDAVTIFLIGLISKNYHKAGTEPLEYLNTNLFNVDADVVQKLEHLLYLCCLDHQTLKIDHESLKDDILAEHNTPCGVMKLNRVYPGSTTHYLISELGLAEGQLSQKATLNILKLKEMIEHKQIWVTFFQSIVKFDLNTSVIGLSEGKSVFPYDLKYRLNQINNTQIEEEIDNSQLSNIYSAIKQLQENLRQVNIEDLDGIKDKYVEARKHHQNFTQHDFTLILKMAKHMACINLRDNVDSAIYDEAEGLWFKVKANLA